MTALVTALDHAVAYMRRGFALVPLNGKKPNVPALRLLRKTASWKALADNPMSDAEAEDIFGRRYPSAGIGILTGAVSGVIVVDIDDPSLAPDALWAWPTLTAETPGGGRHKYFTADVALGIVKLAWGEVRGDGGYVAAPNGKPGRAWLDPAADLRPFSEVAGLLPALSSTEGEGHLSSRGRRCSSPAAASPLSHEVARLERDPELLVRFARQFGRSAVTDRNVPCLLHQPDHDPSARFTIADDGAYLHHCFHDGSSYKLGTIYALVVGGVEPGGMSAIGSLIWQARMLADLGLLPVPNLGFTATPDDMPLPFTAAWEWIKLLFALRSLTTVGMESPLTPEFIAAWCGVPLPVAEALRDYLAAVGLILRVGKQGRTYIWTPALGDTTAEAAA